jgi:quinol monooxygenase YgiN
MGGFVQIVEYETDRADEMKALRDDMRDEGGTPGFDGLTVTQDRDNPRRWLMIVEFASYEEAMANSARPETDAMAKKMAALAAGPPKFHNLDIRETYP